MVARGLVKNGVSGVEQRPRLGQMIVFGGRNRLPGSGDVAVEQVEDLSVVAFLSEPQWFQSGKQMSAYGGFTR
jgi:hypothetical protein